MRPRQVCPSPASSKPPKTFAVLGFYNAYDYFNHLRQKHLPRTDLSGLTLEFDIDYDHALDGAMRLDAAKYPSVSWDAMTFVCGKGGPGEVHDLKLLDYATVVSGGETPASVSVEASGKQAELGFDHIVVMFRDTQYNCVPWGKLYNLPKSISAPNGTIDLYASDLDPVTGELELKVGDTVYFTYDPLYELGRPVRVGGDLPRYRRLWRHGDVRQHAAARWPDHLPVVHAGTVPHHGRSERHPRAGHRRRNHHAAVDSGLGADIRSGRRRYRGGARGGRRGGGRGHSGRLRPDHLHEAGLARARSSCGAGPRWTPSTSRPEYTRAAVPSTTSTSSPPRRTPSRTSRTRSTGAAATSFVLARTSPA